MIEETLPKSKNTGLQCGEEVIHVKEILEDLYINLTKLKRRQHLVYHLELMYVSSV